VVVPAPAVKGAIWTEQTTWPHRASLGLFFRAFQFNALPFAFGNKLELEFQSPLFFVAVLVGRVFAFLFFSFKENPPGVFVARRFHVRLRKRPRDLPFPQNVRARDPPQ
jgi:hypothetical protein|tara:strand:- start:279 stop:605 length:327 start_codon:yes stop_codon:yes gene_type:complete